MRYAKITNNYVENVIISDSKPNSNFFPGFFVECSDEVGIGFTYDDIHFHAPLPPKVDKFLAVGSFFDRFGAQKYPILMSQDAAVKALIQDCSVREYIDLDNEQLPYGLDLLIASGFAVDKNKILTDPIKPSELP